MAFSKSVPLLKRWPGKLTRKRETVILSVEKHNNG